jgi:radical SAM superfamily enzyme YgiQ (UPF0313 family)
MTKVAMVYPSWTKETHSASLLYSPLALGYIARHTPRHYKIDLYDEYVGEDLDPNTVNADIVAFSPITSGIMRAYSLADRLRERGITCVSGGAHASALPDEALQHFDAVIIGEGEDPWKNFLQDFEQGKIQETYFGRMDVSLDHLGTPRRDLVHSNYTYPALMTSRGCPYACSFCYLTVYKNRKHRMIPHDTILEDMDYLKDHPIVVVTDENFIGYSDADIEDRKVLLEKMIRKEYKFYWGCQSTVGLYKQPELMTLMHRAGCRAVFLGFEAMQEDSLAEVNKRHNFGVDYSEVVRALHNHKLGVIASCILGMDSHGKDYHKTLIKSLKKAKADFPRVFLMTAWPGTRLFEELQREDRASRDWDRVRKDMPSVKFKHYTHEEIRNAREEVIRAFASVFHISRVVFRWLFKDRSIIMLFIHLAFRNMILERTKRFRARNTRSGQTDGKFFPTERGRSKNRKQLSVSGLTHRPRPHAKQMEPIEK